MSVKVLQVNVDAIPLELRAIDQWVAWRGVPKVLANGTEKLDKRPINPHTGGAAAVDSPKTWGTFTQAVAAWRKRKLDGIGVVLTDDLGLVGLDLDKCHQPGTDKIDPAALAFVEKVDSYTEFSPSDTGLRIFAWGGLPPVGRKKGHFEMYCTGRFLTVTGNELPGGPDGSRRRDVEKRPAEILEMHLQIFGAQPPPEESGCNGNGNGNGSGKKRPTDELSRVLSALVESDIRLADTWNRRRDEFKEDQSRYDQSLANTLVRAGWLDEEIRFAIGAHRAEHGQDTDKAWKRKDYIERTLAKARNGSGSHAAAKSPDQPEWLKRMRWTRTKYGEFLTRDLANVRDLLLLHPEWAGVIGYEEFDGRIIATKKPPCHPVMKGQNWPRSWTDADDAFLTAWLQRIEPPLSVGIDLAASGLSTAARYRRFHPVREYLDTTRWDETTRLDTWLERYLGAEAEEGGDEYLRAVGAKWMISAVARVREPGSKVDTLLILEGPQGSRKSTALRILGGRWFTDEIDSLHSKDAPLQLQGAWIVELAELDALQRSEVSRVKAFLAKSFDRFRAPYGRHVETHLRQCVFAGTVNSKTYFRDDTGGRRFWPVRCGKIDIEALEQDRDQLWAEASARHAAGETWWLEGALIAAAAEQQEARYQADEWEELIAKYVQAKNRICVGLILSDVLGLNKADWGQPEQNRVVRCLSRLGWERRQVRLTDAERKTLGLEHSKTDRAWVYEKPKGVDGIDSG